MRLLGFVVALFALAGCSTTESGTSSPATQPGAAPTSTYVSQLRPPTEEQQRYLDVLASYGFATEGEAGDRLRLTSARICAYKDNGYTDAEIWQDLQRDGWTLEQAARMTGAADASYCQATAG
jgi:hypothetical protein